MAVGTMGTTTTTRSLESSEIAFCGWQRRVDALCDRFEDAWHEGEEPRIEDYLATCGLPASRQGALLCELLKLERELPLAAGEADDGLGITSSGSPLTPTSSGPSSASRDSGLTSSSG